MAVLCVDRIQIELVRNLETDEIGAWRCGAVEVTRVTIATLVYVFLKSIEDVLHTSIQLQFDIIVNIECVIEFDVEIKEVGCMHHFVFTDVGVGIIRRNIASGRSKVRNVHSAGVNARERGLEATEGSRGECKVTIAIRSSGHVACGSYVGVFAPRLIGFISATLVGETCL